MARQYEPRPGDLLVRYTDDGAEHDRVALIGSLFMHARVWLEERGCVVFEGYLIDAQGTRPLDLPAIGRRLTDEGWRLVARGAVTLEEREAVE